MVRTTTYAENLLSLRVMEKLGMKFVRTVRMIVKERSQADIFHVDSSEVWHGYAVACALTKED